MNFKQKQMNKSKYLEHWGLQKYKQICKGESKLGPNDQHRVNCLFFLQQSWQHGAVTTLVVKSGVFLVGE